MTTTARSLVVLLVLTLTLTPPSNGMTTTTATQSFSEGAEASNLANAQLGGDPISSRVAHLSGDTYPLRKDYIFLVTDPTDTAQIVPEYRRTWLEARRPDNSLIFRVDTTKDPMFPNETYPPMQEIVDVADLNGDGSVEIIGIFEAGRPSVDIPQSQRLERPAIYVFNSDGSVRWNTEQTQRFTNDTGRIRKVLALKSHRVKVYDVLSNSPVKTKRIVAVPNTQQTTGPNDDDYANERNAQGYLNEEAYVYFYDYNGGLPDTGTNPVPAPVPATTESLAQYPNREMLSNPGVVVGNIDDAGGDNEIVVIAKQRILVFNQDGSKVYYKQFVDPGGGFTNYNNNGDAPPGYLPWEGRRYGLYKLVDIDPPSAGGKLELIMAADGNSLPCDNSPGAVYQAFDFSLFSTGDGYVGPNASRWQVHRKASSSELTPSDSPIWPEGYKVGVPFSGIQDINGDGFDEIVVGEITDTRPIPAACTNGCTTLNESCPRSFFEAFPNDATRIVIIQTAATPSGSRVVSTQKAGIPLEVLRWTEGQQYPDIVAYNNVTQEHYVYSLTNPSTFTLGAARVFATGDALLVQRRHSEDFNFGSDNFGTGSPVHSSLHLASTYTAGGITKTVIEQRPRVCVGAGETLRTWAAPNSGPATQYLDVTTSPGRIVNVVCTNDRSESVWIVENRTSCASDTNQVSTYVRSGANLINYPGTGDGSDTIGVYTSSGGGWFLRNENSPGNADTVFTFGPGGGGILPLSGDWNADGEDTAGIYVSSTGTFFLRNSNTSGNADVAVSFGAGGADYLPVVGDWDRDGDDTIGVYHKPSGAFFLKNSNTPGPADITVVFGGGGPNILPVVGDWDGDGQYTIGIYAISSGAFFLRNSNTSGNADVILTFGAGGAGITPIVGDWDGDGDHTVGIYASSSGAFFLRNSNTTGSSDLVFTYGPPNATPLVGNWDGRC
jgi:hypothetical protein